MRLLSLPLIAVSVLVTGCCTERPIQDAGGVWTASFGESRMRIELGRGGHWCWSDMEEAPPPEAPSQEGSWFIREGVLVLKVEESESCKLPPETAFRFDVRSVTTARLTLWDRQMEKEVVWEKVANQPVQATSR